MFVVIGKNNRFTDAFTALHLEPVFHQVLKHFINGIFVVDVLEHFIAQDIAPSPTHRRIERIQSVFVIPDLFKLLTFLFRKFTITNAFVQNFRTAFEPAIFDKISISNSLV